MTNDTVLRWLPFAFPLFFATMIIICAFLPLFTMTGPAGALFGPMANTYAFSILGALLVAVTLAPMRNLPRPHLES